MTLLMPELERQLRAAVRAQQRRRPRRPRAGVVLSALAAAAAIAVAIGALVLIGGHKRSPAPSAAVPGRQQLIDILGVLRRPQTYADLHSPAIAGFLARGQSPVFGGGTVDRPLIRRATTTPWGQGVFVIPIKPTTAASERVFFEVGFGGGCCSSAADIEAGYDQTSEGAGHSFAGGSTQTRRVVLVPDGVAKVEFVFPRQSSATDPGSPIYSTPLRVTVPVHGNVAAVQVDREVDGGPVPMIWYSPAGRVIKRVGNFAKVNRVTAPPKPAPETAQSRAAERDPSTPNHVWVTPSVGRPRAKYTVHFRLLLNDADYRFKISGTTCPQITFAGGGGGGSGDLRGRIFSYSLDAVTGQSWCPGTYHVSVRVMDLGRYGNLKHPAAPFGSATFIVRR